MNRQWISRRARRVPPEQKVLEAFVHSGWPEIQKIAAANGTTPEKVILEAVELEFFVNREFGGIITEEGAEKWHGEMSKPVINSINWLSTKQKIDFKKLKKNELGALILIVNSLENSARFTMHAESELYGVSLVNPFLPMDAEQVRHVFDTLAEVGEEAALSRVVGRQEVKHPALALKDQEKSAIDIIHQTSPSEEKHVAVPTPVEAATQKRSETPLELKDFIASKIELVDRQVYKFRNANGEDYLIQFSNDIAKEAHKGHDRAIKRLLSSLYLTNNGKSGIKLLPSLGKDIMEIKAPMRGHKRMIGCLKGRQIEIKMYFNDIPASLDSYARLIPGNLCAD
jgi:hypothetical protein